MVYGRHGSEIYPSDRQASPRPSKHVQAYGWHFCWDSQLVQTVLLEGLIHLQFPNLSLHLLTIVVLRNVAQNPALLISLQKCLVIKCQLKDCSSYTVQYRFNATSHSNLRKDTTRQVFKFDLACRLMGSNSGSNSKENLE